MNGIVSAIIIFGGLMVIADEIKELRISISKNISYFEFGYQAGVKEKNRDR